MKKKQLMMGLGFGIGAAMLLAGGLSAMANTSGYEAYKGALKMSMSAASLTNEGHLRIADNGAEVMHADFTFKMDRALNTASVAAAFGSGTEEKTVQVYSREDAVIVKEEGSRAYRVMEKGERGPWHAGKPSGPPEQAEALVDALMGQLKELAAVTERPDGGKQASLHLSGSQIPAVVRTAGALAVSRLADTAHWKPGSDESAAFAPALPKLTDNINVQQIHLDAAINAEQYLEHQTAELVITGTDVSGKIHELVLTLDFNLSGFNQTVPDTVDLTGKPVERMEKSEGKHAPWHR